MVATKPKRDYLSLLKTNYKIEPDTDKRNENIREFINKYMRDEQKEIGLQFIKSSLKEYYKLKSDEIKIFNSYFSVVKKEYDGSKKKQEVDTKNKDRNNNIINTDLIINEINKHLRFEIVGESVINKVPLFVMYDTNEVYIYENGIYKPDSNYEHKIKKIINEEYILLFKELNRKLYPELVINDIPLEKRSYISEVIEHIKNKKFIERKEIDRTQGRYINCKNGLFDLKDWKFIPHTPEIIMIRQINAYYNPYAVCHRINKFFDEIFQDEKDRKKEYTDTIIEFSGYSLTPDVRMQKALLLYGGGNNGKSSVIKLISYIIGDDSRSSVSLHEIEEDKFASADLYGKTLNVCSDLGDRPLESLEMFKKLVSGIDSIRAQKKNMNAFEFYNTAKFLFSTNKAPSLGDRGDFAYYRKWMAIPFNHKFEGKNIDKDLMDKLTTEEEISGFLNLMLEGLKRILDTNEFSYKYTVEETQMMIELNSNNVRVFAKTCLIDCDYDNGEEPENSKDVYESYEEWCRELNIKPVSQTKFTQELGKMGRPIKRTTKSYGSDVRHYNYYENTCLASLDEGYNTAYSLLYGDPKGNSNDIDKINGRIDGTKEKFEDKLNYEDPFPGLSNDIKQIL